MAGRERMRVEAAVDPAPLALRALAPHQLLDGKDDQRLDDHRQRQQRRPLAPGRVRPTTRASSSPAMHSQESPEWASSTAAHHAAA